MVNQTSVIISSHKFKSFSVYYCINSFVTMIFILLVEMQEDEVDDRMAYMIPSLLDLNWGPCSKCCAL